MLEARGLQERDQPSLVVLLEIQRRILCFVQRGKRDRNREIKSCRSSINSSANKLTSFMKIRRKKL